MTDSPLDTFDCPIEVGDFVVTGINGGVRLGFVRSITGPDSFRLAYIGERWAYMAGNGAGGWPSRHVITKPKVQTIDSRWRFVQVLNAEQLQAMFYKVDTGGDLLELYSKTIK